jgi:hypothetical protein
VVLGGTLLTGGVGLVGGTLFGGLILGLIATIIDFDGTLTSAWARVVTGLLLAYYWSPEISAWFRLDSNVSVYVVTKLALLIATLGLALNAKLRVIPNINRDNMHVLASHIVLVTVMSIGFLLAGIAIRTGGLF